LASTDRIFYGILFWLLYTTFGPWNFHEVLDGHIGYAFLWGTFVKGTFVPGTLSYWYGLHQMMFFQLPLTVILAGVLKRRYNTFIAGGMVDTSMWVVLKKNLPFVALLIAETLLAIFYLIQNGIVSFLIAPVRVWGLLFSVFLFYQAQWKVPDHCFKTAAMTLSAGLKQSTS